MSPADREPFTHRSRSAPRPLQQPSRLAQTALIIVGIIALTLLVVQIVAGGHGLISGQASRFEPAAAIEAPSH